MAPAKTARARMRAQARKKKRQARVAASGAENTASAAPAASGNVAPVAGALAAALSTGLAHLERGEVEAAIGALRAATAADGASSAASDALARGLLEAGDPGGAEAELRRGLQHCPASFERRMNLAQLSCDPDAAVAHLEAGLAALSSAAATSAGAATAGAEEELRALRTRANCALAEALLAAAERAGADVRALDARCEAAVTAALADAPARSPAEVEAQLCLANLRLSQGRGDEARAAMRAVWTVLARPLHTLGEAERAGEGALCSPEAVQALSALPEAHVRIAIGKQFVETALWTFGVRVLESVLWECDFNVEVWYMLALCYLRNGKVGEARDAVTSLGEAKESPDGFDGTLDDAFLEELVREIEEEEKKIGGRGEGGMDES